MVRKLKLLQLARERLNMWEHDQGRRFTLSILDLRE